MLIHSKSRNNAFTRRVRRADVAISGFIVPQIRAPARGLVASKSVARSNDRAAAVDLTRCAFEGPRGASRDVVLARRGIPCPRMLCAELVPSNDVAAAIEVNRLAKVRAG